MKLVFDEYLPLIGQPCNPIPVIMLHGRLDSRKTWKCFAPQIAQKTGRKVYALDARNHGDSSWTDEMNFEVITNDLEEFMEDQCIAKALLIGHSMGGRTSITLALRKPEKVEKLIVEDMGVENYTTRAKTAVLHLIYLLRKSLNSIPDDADEMTAKKAITEFIRSSLPPDTTKKGDLYDLDALPIKKVGKKYSWKANLDVLEDMLKNKVDQTLAGVYNGDALFFYGNKSFFDVKKSWRRDSLPYQTKEDVKGVKRLQNVSAITRIAGTEIKTIYHFGPDTEYIEVLIDGEVKVKVVKNEAQAIYSNTMKQYDFPSGAEVCTTSVLEANGCVIKTVVSKKGNREAIAVYKNDILLVRAGNTQLQ